MSFKPDPKLLRLLVAIGKLGGIKKDSPISTSDIGKEIGVSQQTASRWLKKAIQEGLISKISSGKTLRLRVTPKGRKTLDDLFRDLWVLFSQESSSIEKKVLEREKQRIVGIVIQGMGEGRYYMSLDGYRRQFDSILPWSPYPGTLNLRLKNEISQERFLQLTKQPGELLTEFGEKDLGRTFGKVFLWPVEVLIGEEVVKAAVIKPGRTHHTEVVELIAENNIRDTFGVKDGDEIIIIFDLK